MAPKSTSEMIQVMQAFVEGKVIQCLRKDSSGVWTEGASLDWNTVTWNWDAYDYRVKPEPREWWLAPCAGPLFHSKSSAQAHLASLAMPNNEIVHVREVME